MDDSTVSVHPVISGLSNRERPSLYHEFQKRATSQLEEETHRSVFRGWPHTYPQLDIYDTEQKGFNQKRKFFDSEAYVYNNLRLRSKENPIPQKMERSCMRSRSEVKCSEIGSRNQQEYQKSSFNGRKDFASKTSQRDNLKMLSEAASLVPELKNIKTDDECYSSSSENGVNMKSIPTSNILYGYSMTPAQRDRYNGSTSYMSPQGDIRTFVREFTANIDRTQTSRLAAARTFYFTGYPLSKMADLDCKYLCEEYSKSWLHDETTPKLILPNHGYRHPNTSVEEYKINMLKSLNPMIELVKKAERDEMKAIAKHTGLVSTCSPNGTYRYRECSTGHSVAPARYSQRYKFKIEQIKNSQKKDYNEAVEKAHGSWMKPYAQSKKHEKEKLAVKNDGKDEHKLEMKRKELCQSFSSLFYSIPKVEAVRVADDRNKIQYPLMTQYVNSFPRHKEVESYYSRAREAERIEMLPTLGRQFHPFRSSLSPRNLE